MKILRAAFGLKHGRTTQSSQQAQSAIRARSVFDGRQIRSILACLHNNNYVWKATRQVRRSSYPQAKGLMNRDRQHRNRGMNEHDVVVAAGRPPR